jgi:chitodextrinase
VNQKRKQIQLSWNASTDNVGIAAYRVSKNGTVVGTAISTAWTDPSYTSGTYSVAAYDLAGNTSAQSAAVTVSLSGGGRK